MTKREREGLEQLVKDLETGTNPGIKGLFFRGADINAALDWIHRQLTIDQKRRKKRGK